MPGKEKTAISTAEDRKRNNSKPAKGMVGDIAEAFKRQIESPNSTNNASSPVPSRKQSARLKSKEESKKSSKPNDEGLVNTQDDQIITEEGENEDEVSQDNEHDDIATQPEHQRETESIVEDASPKDQTVFETPEGDLNAASQEVQTESLRRKTEAQAGENANIMRSLQDIQKSLKKMDEAIFHPKNGIEVQLAKTTQRVDDIYTDIHGAVSGILVKLQAVEDSSKSNKEKIENMESSLTRLTKLLDENKKITQE